MANIHVGDIGTEIAFTIVDQDSSPLSLVGYTVLRVLLKAPSGTVLTRTGVLSSDGTDGKMKYLSVSGDFAESGLYHFQAYVELPGGKWHSDEVKHKVLVNLD